MKELFLVVIASILWICFAFCFAIAHEMDIRKQLLTESRTNFLFATDIRVDNPRTIEYITIEKETK